MWYSKGVKESQKRAAYPYNEFTKAILYSRSLLGVVGGYFLPLKDCVTHSPTRDTMKSAYLD
ncbi:MAG: hypothetical protein ACLSEY_18475 [Enterocloster sp.]